MTLDNILLASPQQQQSHTFSSSLSTLGQQDTFLLADFGLATPLCRDGKSDPVEGDQAYRPPELGGTEPNYSDLRKTDIYAFGLILLQMIAGVELPNAGPQWRLIRQPEHVGGLLEPIQCSPLLKQLILQCLKPNPIERPTAEQLLTLATAFLPRGSCASRQIAETDLPWTEAGSPSFQSSNSLRVETEENSSSRVKNSPVPVSGGSPAIVAPREHKPILTLRAKILRI